MNTVTRTKIKHCGC